jgi:hypothetical protein
MQQKVGTMRARDFITELFRPGQDINFKWSRPFKDEVNVLGKTPQGHELSINFWEITDDIVAIDFTIDADVEQDPDPDTSPKSGHELTRHGEEFAVFTQVVNAITQYLNKLPKNNVFFQVKRTEAQREPLYLKIANRVAKQLGFRQGTEQELEATNPGLYNKFDNRYSKLLWYTNTPQGMAEGLENNRISFQIQKGKNKFATTLSISNYPVGVYQYDADTGRSIAEVYPEFKGKGLGKLLVLHAIYTAAQLGLNFQEDESRTAEYDNVLDSLSSNGYIVDDDGYWYVTGEGEQYLQQSMKQGVAEGFPNFNREWDEATRYPEFVNLGKEKWIELVSKGKPVTVTRKNVNKINNTDAADPKSFKLLDPEKQKRALAQLDNGDVEMPIVARYSDGYLELIGGNTRLTAQMAKDGQAKVWLFNVPEELTQGVAEAFNQPYATDLEKSEHDDYDSLVQLPDGSHLSIMFNHQGDAEYQVEFWRGPSQEVTGEGDAQRIFATVLNTIQKFIKEHNPWRLTFSATKDVAPGQNSESRAKLYNRLVDRYAAAWGYDALINDLGDQVEYELTRLKPGMAEEQSSTPTMGINVRSDGDIDYASLIVDGQKKYESRKTDSLGPYVGKTVGIVRTGSGPAVAIGQVTIGEPIVVDAEKFNKLRKQHLVPQGSKFDIDVDGTKYLYPMINPVRWANERLIKHRGIVSRKIQEQGVSENFKDGKNPGRKGLSKRMGVNTKASVSALRKVAKNSSGEKQRMAHWLANMKSGRKKS